MTTSGSSNATRMTVRLTTGSNVLVAAEPVAGGAGGAEGAVVEPEYRDPPVHGSLEAVDPAGVADVVCGARYLDAPEDRIQQDVARRCHAKNYR